MKENKDQNQGWKHFKGDTIGVIVEDPTGSIPRCPKNREIRGKAPKKSTKQPWYQRAARMLVIILGFSGIVLVIIGMSIFWYSTSRDTPFLYYEDQYALHKGSVYTHNKETIVLADDKKGFIEMVSYLNMDKQMLVTTRALGTNRYFAFVWVPKSDSFDGAYGLIDYNCDRQYTPMIIGGGMVIPTCFRKILTDKMAPISPTSPKKKPDIVL